MNYEQFIKYCKKNKYRGEIEESLENKKIIFRVAPRKDGMQQLYSTLKELRLENELVHIWCVDEETKREIQLDQRRKNRKYNVVGYFFSRKDIRGKYPIYLYLREEIFGK